MKIWTSEYTFKFKFSLERTLKNNCFSLLKDLIGVASSDSLSSLDPFYYHWGNLRPRPSHPWATVAQAAWRKYPNPMNTAVIGTDVVDRKVVDGVLYTHRLVSSQWLFPQWARPFVGSTNVCYASEHSEVNPEKKEMVLKTRNLSLCNYIAVDETVRYVPHPNDPEKTLLMQEAVVTVRGMPLTSYVESVMTTSISSNAGKGRQAIEWVISKIEEEVKEFKNSAVKSTDEIINQTKKSIDDIANSALKSMDEISSKISFDGFANDLPSGQLPKF